LLYFLKLLIGYFLGVDFPERVPHVDLELVPCHLQSALVGDQWLESAPGYSLEQGSSVSCFFLIIIESVSFGSEFQLAVGQE
jgi:hypothetical protein